MNSLCSLVTSTPQGPEVSREVATREFCLTRQQAADWLRYLDHHADLAAADEVLGEFYDVLSDAHWLARWKRESVLLELELPLIATLVARLSSTPAGDEQGLGVVGDILQTLGRP